MAIIITLILSNVPAILLAVALVAPPLRHGQAITAGIWLDWVLLVGLGLPMLWAAFYHLVLPNEAAHLIGWASSPFQFEVGIADLAMGVVACLAFWQARPFKAAITIVLAIALIGDALGHIYQMATTGNFAPGNAGSIFWWDIVAPLTALVVLVQARCSGPVCRE